MEFDKSRVYTALNADELKVGSKVYVSDNMYYLKKCVEDNLESCILTEVLLEKEASRFCINDTFNEQWALAYLIEPPAEPKYKPFSDIEKTFEIIKKHGGWVKEKINGDLQLVSHIGKITDGMLSISCWTSETLLENFVFADDDSPCGELVDE